jgi:prenyltransferase beta subunit
MKEDIEERIDNAKNWLYKYKSGSSFCFKVISECPVSTALALYVVEGNIRSKAIEYLINIKVWEKNLFAAALFVCALKECGEDSLADEIFEFCEKELKKKPSEKQNRVLQHQVYHKTIGKLMEEIRYTFPIGLSEKNLSLIPVYTTFFRHTSQRYWYSRTSFFHDFFPFIAPMLVSSNDNKLNRRVVETLIKAMNEDGSYGGVTAPTILSICVLRKFGNEYYVKKSLKWLENAMNENGSFRPLLRQDVYDTAWVSLAFANLGEDVSDSIDWLKSTKISHGYPYVSSGYFPDPDDTSLVLLSKKYLNQVDNDDYGSLDFLLESQNSDGGWCYCPLYKYAILYKMLAIFLNGIGLFTTSRKRGYGFLAMLHPTRNYLSTIDMTARALITLSNFKNDARVEKSINNGIKYLLSHCYNGRFHSSHKWTFSDIYETSMALIALYKNGVRNEKTNSAMKWLLKQQIEFAEDAAHVLWALVEGDHEREYMEDMVDIILSSQLPDGSWKPNVGFFLGSAKYYSLFSIASPLYALALYKNRYGLTLAEPSIEEPC